MRWPVGLYRVSGASMLPSYRDGDLVVGWRWYRPGAGRVVVARTDRPVIKRLIRRDSTEAWLQGDNLAASLDSRHLGPVSLAAIEAVVVTRLIRGKLLH